VASLPDFSNGHKDLDRTPSSVLSTMLRSISIGGFECRERQIAGRSVNPRHSHDYDCIGFLISGRGTAEFGSRSWTVQPGCLNVIPRGVQHAERLTTREVRWCAIEIPALLDDFSAEARRAFDRPYQIKGGAAAAIAVRIYREIQLADNASTLALHGLGLELLATLARMAGPPSDGGRRGWIARAEDYLRANFLEPITLDELAVEAGVHPTHLARVFRRKFGVSMGQFVRGLRIEHAARLLAEEDLPLSQVSESSGFSDQAHFTRVFKQHVGMTPGAYRLRLRGR
jgi:AraC family transcriptional regulator